MRRYTCSLIKVLAVLSVLAATSVAWAQGVTGSAVTGTITEEGTGAPVAGAFVQLKNTATGDSFTAVTADAGTYFIDNVPAGGPYLLTVTSPAYKQASKRGLTLQLGQRLQVDQVMSANIEEIVVVDQIDPLKDKERTGPSTTMSESTIGKIPLQGRNFTDLLSTTPQANGESIAGQNNRYNNIQIDGGANNDLFGLAPNGTPGGQANAKPISLEAIKEFVVQVAPFDVRQSSFTGGLVNAITKSGTNEFHGDAFGYFQNKSLAGNRADPTFLNFNTWQFGADVGGPIIENKVHFFASVDLQAKNQSFGNTFQLTGDPINDAKTQGFTLAEVQRFQNDLAQKGITNAGNGLAPTQQNPDRNIFAKVTTNQIPNSRLEVTYNLVDASQDILIRNPLAPRLPTVNAAGVETNVGNLRDGYELSNSGYGQANTTNTARFKLTTNWGDFSNEALGGVSIIRDHRDLPNKLPLILVDLNDLNDPTIQQDGGGKNGTSDAWLAAGGERFSHQNVLDQDIYELQDNLTYSGLAGHHLTLGTSNEFLRIRNVFFQSAYGIWAFKSLNAFEAGTPEAYQRRFAVSNLQDPGTAKFSVVQPGVYVQDEWEVTKNLTLTPGFRVDVPFLNKAVTNPALVNAAFPIDTGVVPSGNALLSPRLGVNWNVEGDATTIVRGGVGLFTGRPPYVWIGNAYAGNGLSQVELGCTATTGIPAFTLDPNNQPTSCTGGTGTLMVPPGEIDYFDPKTRYPQNFRVAAGVDQRLPFGIVASGDFLYTRDVNGWYTADMNLVHTGTDAQGRELYGTITGTNAVNSFRANPTRIDTMDLTSAIKVYNKSGGRVYNATGALSKTFADRYELDAAYTYSNSEDRISLTSSQAFSNYQFAPVDGSLRDRNLRPSAFDRRHKITLAGAASLPYGFGAGLVYNLVSGLPYTWTVNGDVNADGISSNDLVFVPANASQITLADPTQYDGPKGLAAFIDSQKCLKEAEGHFVQRGACRNPWTEFLNVRGTWQSPAVMGQRVQVQLDVFNVLNLLNNKWGLFNQATGFENVNAAFLKASGYDTVNGRPIYQFIPPNSVVSTLYNPTTSRWRIQLGARYNF
jgi:hypothetical protein